MYLDNKYTKCYFRIISNAQARNHKTKRQAKLELGYVERHHIIPRSIGGSDEKSNLVYLTAREHFICHLLLIKMVHGIYQKKMMFALQNFKTRKKDKFHLYKIGGRIYEMIKKSASIALSEMNAGKVAWNKGLTQSEESNEKRSATLRGTTHSIEHKRKNSSARLGSKRTYSSEGIQNIVRAANLRKGISLPPEIVKNRLGYLWWNNGVSETKSKTQPGPDFIRGRLKLNIQASLA